jgi:Leucine-rich repeat (LRR) protein
MLNSRTRRGLLVAFALCGVANWAGTAGAWAPVPLTPDVVEAYQQAGGEFGGFIVDVAQSMTFYRGSPQGDGYIPGFRFTQPPPNGFDKLPPVGVSFGISLQGEWVTEEHMNQLAALNRLTFLELRSSSRGGFGRGFGERGVPGGRAGRGAPGGRGGFAPRRGDNPEAALPKGFSKLQHLTALSLPTAYLPEADLVELKKMKKLTHLHLPRADFPPSGLESLAELENLHELYLGISSVPDAGMAQLAKLKGLQTLIVPGRELTPEGLKYLGNLKKLTTFYAPGLRITDGELKVLADLDLLHALHVATSEGRARPTRADEVTSLYLVGRETAVTDAGLPLLARLKKLRSLTLGGEGITDAGLKTLREFPELGELTLLNTSVTDEGLAHLAGLEGLKKLDLIEPKITDAGLDTLARLTGLTSLNLSGTEISDASLKHLRTMRNLNTLTLDGTKVSDAGLAHLGKLPLLVHLSLTNTRVSDRGLDHLLSLENLQFLSLSGTDITPLGLKKLAGLKNLNRLGLSEEQITDRCVFALRDAGKLHTLPGTVGEAGDHPVSPEDIVQVDLARSNVTNDVLECFAGLKNIREISLPREQLTDRALRQLRRLNLLHTLRQAQTASNTRPGSLEEIAILDLSSVTITDRGLEVLHDLKNLTTLRLDRTRITESGLIAIQQALGPKCSIIAESFSSRGGFGDPRGFRPEQGGFGGPGGFGRGGFGRRGDRDRDRDRGADGGGGGGVPEP